MKEIASLSIPGRHYDWKDVDAMTTLCKEAGVSPGDLVKKLGDELKALGIKKSK